MDAVAQVLQWAQEYLGFSWDDAAYGEVRRKLSLEAKDRGLGDAQDFARYLIQEVSFEERSRLLASILTIGETYFFRELEALQTFVDRALPEILRCESTRPGKTIRLWSAGCSTGEEAYTVAMILTEALKGHRPWTFTVLATDINVKALERARLGLYHPYSFRRSVPEFYSPYFSRDEGEVIKVREGVKERVRFEVLNLAGTAYPSPANGTWNLDAVLCRNVLMYLHADGRREVLRRFHRSLREGGWLILSASELHLADSTLWEPVRTDRATLFRKKSEAVPEQEKPVGLAASLRPVKASLPTAGLKACNKPSSRHGVAPQDFEAELERLVRCRFLDEAVVMAEKGLRTATTAGSVEASRVSKALVSLIRALADGTEGEKALRLLDRALAVHKWDPALYHLKGALHADRGEWQEAVAAYRQMLYVAPQSASALFSLAMLSLREGQRDAVRRYLDGSRKALEGQDDREEVPFSDGMSVGHLRHLIEQFRKTLDGGSMEAAP